MSLKDDLEVMRRHKANGTLAAWFRGTAPALAQEPWPSDPTARFSGPTHILVCLRGD